MLLVHPTLLCEVCFYVNLKQYFSSFFIFLESNTGSCVQHNDHMCQIRSSKIQILSSVVWLHGGYHHWLHTFDLVLIFCSSVPVLTRFLCFQMAMLHHKLIGNYMHTHFDFRTVDIRLTEVFKKLKQNMCQCPLVDYLASLFIALLNALQWLSYFVNLGLIQLHQHSYFML